MTQTAEKTRAVRAAAARRRRSDSVYREKQNARSRLHYAEGRYDQANAAWVAKAKAEFFPWHIRFFRKLNKEITVEDIRAMWDAQEGLCALTGTPLIPNPLAEAGHLAHAWDEPHIDHIIPVSRGGTHDLSNLRWVCARVNLAKRDLLDEEFLELCRSVVEAAS